LGFFYISKRIGCLTVSKECNDQLEKRLAGEEWRVVSKIGLQLGSKDLVVIPHFYGN
jgi:hypothetical protein